MGFRSGKFVRSLHEGSSHPCEHRLGYVHIIQPVLFTLCSQYIINCFKCEYYYFRYFRYVLRLVVYRVRKQSDRMAQKRRATVEIDDVYDIVEQLATRHRRAMAGQIRLFVDEALFIRGLIDDPDLPPDSIEALEKLKNKQVALPELNDSDDSESEEEAITPIATLLKKLINGHSPSNDEIVRTAGMCGIDTEVLMMLCDEIVKYKQKEKEPNGCG